MKIYFLSFVITLFYTNVFSQTISELSISLDSLKLIMQQIESDIDRLENKRAVYKEKIAEINQKIFRIALVQETEKGILTTAFSGKLRDAPNINGEIVMDINSGDTIKVFSFYEEPYLKVDYKGVIGYISRTYVKVNDKIESIIAIAKEKKESSKSSNTNYRRKSSTKYNSKNKSVRCSAITQKGVRCHRMTTASNGRCYQH